MSENVTTSFFPHKTAQWTAINSAERAIITHQPIAFSLHVFRFHVIDIIFIVLSLAYDEVHSPHRQYMVSIYSDNMVTT